MQNTKELLNLKVEETDAKLSYMRLPSKSEISGRCENEAFVLHFPPNVKVDHAKNGAFVRDFSPKSESGRRENKVFGETSFKNEETSS